MNAARSLVGIVQLGDWRESDGVWTRDHVAWRSDDATAEVRVMEIAEHGSAELSSPDLFIDGREFTTAGAADAHRLASVLRGAADALDRFAGDAS